MLKLHEAGLRRKIVRLAKVQSRCVPIIAEDEQGSSPRTLEIISQLNQIRRLIKIGVDNNSLIPCSESLIFQSLNQDNHRMISAICARLKPDYVVMIKTSDNMHILNEFEKHGVPVVCLVTSAIPSTDDGDAIFYTSSRIVFHDSAARDAATDVRPWLVIRSTTTLPDLSETQGQALEAIGQEAMALKAHTLEDEATIRESGLFDREFYLGSQRSDPWRDAVKEFVKTYQTAYPYLDEAGQLLRRPCKGFDPVGYMNDCGDWPAGSPQNPFAHFIRQGMPEGIWRWKTVPLKQQTARAPQQAAVLHAHFFYADLIEDFVARLRANAVGPHLIITTDSETKKDALGAKLTQLDCATFEIRVHENRGRDIGPFLTLLRTGAFDNYPIVGHVHAKQSPHLREMGATWRTFTWEHLLGGRAPSIDIIAKLFADDNRLGLIFAEEQYQYGWGSNKDIAKMLVKAMGLNDDLPQRFQFPAGTMFWARPEAIRRLDMLGQEPFDFPGEPLALDGTILHAIERIIPFVVEGSGYSWATVTLDTFY